MGKSIEFHGRLSRSDRRPASPGRYDLLFQLHPSHTSDAVLWSETHRNVEVAPGGFFNLALGQVSELTAALFERTPRWLSTRVLRGGTPDEEYSSRVPLLGGEILLADRLDALQARIEAVERGGVRDDESAQDRVLARFARLRDALEEVGERLGRLESSDGQRLLDRRFEQLGERMGRIDGEGGRLERIEDELEDLVGPDGDVVDLNERMDSIEGRAPELIATLRARQRGESEDRFEALKREVESLRVLVGGLGSELDGFRGSVAAVGALPEPTPETIGAVKRSGDVMTGGLTINRGGLEVLSGGVTCRGANVTTLEASNLVKTPKLISDAIELRGDLTVDNSRRVIQCRMIEGRQGSARRDGALHLNARGGAEVVIGNPEASKGAQVYGSLQSDQGAFIGDSVAIVAVANGELQPGDIVRISDDGARACRTHHHSDTRVMGVVTDNPGVLLGGSLAAGKVAVAIQGMVRCLAEAESGPIRPGDLLVTSEVAGHARAASAPTPGSVIGKALEPLESGRGLVSMLVWGR